MSQGWHLGGRWYIPALDLGITLGDCSWWVLQDDDTGARWLMQRWLPRVTDRELDQVKEIYLQRFTGAVPMDPPTGRFGFDDSHVWFLQKLQDLTLAEIWPHWNAACRETFLRHFRKALKQDMHPRLLHPELITLRNGRVLVPRVIGDAPLDVQALESLLEAPPGDQNGPRFWEQPPDLFDPVALPIRGRGQELTYLKSLMLGLASPAPMERIAVLQGEEGMGLNRLGEWAAAAAETESFWVRSFTVQPEEKAGAFLGRMLQSLLKGLEADLYAQSPETARILARRMPSFAFLRGGLKLAPDLPVEPAEVKAALAILEFVSGFHPRMIQVHGVEQGDEELQSVLAELASDSGMAWFLSITHAGTEAGAPTLVTLLQNHPSSALVHLNRLEDHELLDLLDDLLHPNRLDSDFRMKLCQASLGNPGLMRGVLENLQMEGTLVWHAEQGWVLKPGRTVQIKVHEDTAGKVLSGRMQRLGAAGMAVIHMLSLAEQPLDIPVLGAALGIAGDPLEDVLRSVASSKLVNIKDGVVWLASHRVRDLALDRLSQDEIRRMARILVKALGEDIHPVLSVHLETLASDDATALKRVLEMAGKEHPPRPQDAERIVHRALRLHPTPVQTARLWEFLSDAWTQATLRGRMPTESGEAHSPYEYALEALEKAKEALDADTSSASLAGSRIRLCRKEAFLRIQTRDLPRATRAIHHAAECMKEHPLHPEQPLLRLALGKIHLMQGYFGKGIKALEEGLQYLTTDGVGSGHREQVSILLELGKAQAARCQFQRALTTLQSAQRMMEHDQDYHRLAHVHASQGTVFLYMGQPEAAYGHFREALQAARIQDDMELQGRCHLHIGIFKSCRQALGSALTHLDYALDRFEALHDRIAIAEAKAWKARTLAALGDTAQCDILLLQALDIPKAQLSAQEWGDFIALQAEVVAFRNGWRDASRLYLSAVNVFEGAGLLWKERLARLRHLQALAHLAIENRNPDGLNAAWGMLEQQKALVEGSGSRWLDLEWHQTHALLLATIPDTSETITMESLTALTSMLSAAREMRFPSEVLQASALSATQLLKRGESLGARSRLQDALSSFQELWSKVPESMEMSFLGRPDIHQFMETLEAVGVPFTLPERTGTLADWTPTQITLPVLNLY